MGPILSAVPRPFIIWRNPRKPLIARSIDREDRDHVFVRELSESGGWTGGGYYWYTVCALEIVRGEAA